MTQYKGSVAETIINGSVLPNMGIRIEDLMLAVLDRVKDNPREAGKCLQGAAENYVVEILNRLGHKPRLVNKSGYDIITENNLRINVKFRGGGRGATPYFYLEQTRRNSTKKKKSQNTGHEVPSINECDYYAFVHPLDKTNYLDPSSWSVILISSKACEDPNNPGYVKPRLTIDMLSEGAFSIEDFVPSI